MGARVVGGRGVEGRGVGAEVWGAEWGGAEGMGGAYPVNCRKLVSDEKVSGYLTVFTKFSPVNLRFSGIRIFVRYYECGHDAFGSDVLEMYNWYFGYLDDLNTVQGY